MTNELVTLETQSSELEQQTKGLLVRNQDEYNHGSGILRTIKDMQSTVKETFRPIIDKAHSAHKEALAQEKKYLQPLIQLAETINKKLLGYIHQQELLRIEAERKLQAEAEKKRQEALRAADAARMFEAEVEAEQHEEKAAAIITPKLAPTVDRGAAVIKKLYHTEVYDLMALVKAIAEGKAPLNFIEPNMPVLNKYAREFKDQMEFPGVKAVAEDNLSLRRE